MPRVRGLDRAAVVAAAAALADTSGAIEAITLTQLADHFGIRIPSLYNHIGGLAELRQEVAALGLRELYAALQRAAVGRAGPEALGAIGHAYRSFAHECPGRYAATLRADADDPDQLASAQLLIDLLLRVLAPLALGDDSLHVVRGLRSLLHGFVALEAAGGFGMPLDRDASFDRLLTTYIAGLRAA